MAVAVMNWQLFWNIQNWLYSRCLCRWRSWPQAKGITTPVMVLNSSAEQWQDCMRWDLEPEVYSLDFMNKLQTFEGEKSLKIHLKLDTGMFRLGLLPEDISEAKRLFHSGRSILPLHLFLPILFPLKCRNTINTHTNRWNLIWRCMMYYRKDFPTNQKTCS